MSTIYIRTLKRADNTVFCVEDRQKSYYDPVFRKGVPYSSGQQVKRSLLDTVNQILHSPGSPTTFMWEVNEKKELEEGEAFGTCDPTYADQLFGGWMLAIKGGKERTLKRRSPLSISSMRALHPLLAAINKEDITFNRSHRPNNTVLIRDAKGNILTDKQTKALIESKNQSLARKWIPENSRATGLFVQDMAIDLRRLFSVSLNQFEPEISSIVESKLRKNNWKDVKTVFGPCLIAPKPIRDKWIDALADAIISWKITSNQSTTFHPMETLALAIGNDANKIAASIRAKYLEDGNAQVIIEESINGIETFVTLPGAACFLTKRESIDALDKAREKIVKHLKGFNYEKPFVGQE
jgi:hypothetical protein